MVRLLIATAATCVLTACGGAGTNATTSFNADLANASLGPEDSSIIGPATSVEDASFADLLNGMRIASDLAPVTYDARLDSAAQKHAQDMAENDYFSHTSLDGRDVLARIQAEGYEPRAWGENLAGRQQSEEEALTAWINSPDHDALLNADTLEDFALGVAGVGSQTRWVLLMATER
jgi:uncharacterized protein YkwD